MSDPKAVPFPEGNFVYRAPPGLETECSDLPCHRSEYGAVSLWKFPLWKRVVFLVTGRLWVMVLSDSHPPIAFSVSSPFKKKQAAK